MPIACAVSAHPMAALVTIAMDPMSSRPAAAINVNDVRQRRSLGATCRGWHRESGQRVRREAEEPNRNQRSHAHQRSPLRLIIGRYTQWVDYATRDAVPERAIAPRQSLGETSPVTIYGSTGGAWTAAPCDGGLYDRMASVGTIRNVDGGTRRDIGAWTAARECRPGAGALVSEPTRPNHRCRMLLAGRLPPS